MRLTARQKAILLALQAGDRLKVHRTQDGEKRYLLHRLDDSDAVEMDGAAVDALERAGLIESNMKFPAATFLLTDKGLRTISPAGSAQPAPAGPRNFP